MSDLGVIATEGTEYTKEIFCVILCPQWQQIPHECLKIQFRFEEYFQHRNHKPKDQKFKDQHKV